MVYVTLFTLASIIVLAGDIKEETTQSTSQIHTFGTRERKHVKLFVLIIVSAALILLAVGVVFFIYRCSRSAASIPPPQTDAAIEMQPDPAILDAFPQYPYPCEGHVTFGDTCGICLELFIDGETVSALPSCRHIYHPQCISEWVVRARRRECPICRSVIV